MLEQSHNLALVAAAVAVSLMASFTGLSLTRGSMALAEGPRKRLVAMAAVALGGGIWAMHFIAMLGLRLPVLYYYDALVTLISALVAILLVGVALLLVHFRPRTRASVTLAGILAGAGIPAMHYIGMSAIRLCQPVYDPAGTALTWAVSVALGVLSFRVAYGARRVRNIVLGTLCLGLAVVAVHFLAMAGTGFLAAPSRGGPQPGLDNARLAMIVTVVAFVFCGAFLLSGVSFLRPAPEEAAAGAPPAAATPARLRVPYEREGRTLFLAPAEIAALRAEGHYTILYAGGGRLFCPWSISEAAARLEGPDFVRTHRSYLVNIAHVTGFERLKDTGLCYFEATPGLGKVPVSRSRLAGVRAALGL